MKRILPLVLVLLLTACGVRPTDGVISAGPAPAFPGRNQTEMTLYFLLDGRIYPITRATPGVASPESTLRAVVSGPNDEERRRGLDSAVPRSSKVAYNDQLTVFLPVPLADLPKTALDQLSCTTVTSGLWGNLRVVGTDAATSDLVGCPTF
ncbi:hypothetical protein [Amycolatopsis magusensis]|nr:hypothetical protein [Amycolatopsis magusensis]MDI5977344.1 hypothetical protein [Amycolatopsis magusensis]